MAKCAFCGTTILFGGKKEGTLSFCNDKCHAKGRVLLVANQVPDDLVKRQAREIFSGLCPVCKQRRGPVDVHTAHKVWSFILMTQWESQPRVSCRPCGLKRQLFATASSLLVGWWGIPWGLLVTPIQVFKNLWAIARYDESTQPSANLENV